MLSDTLKIFLTQAPAKAFGTTGTVAVNVVPVSMIRVNAAHIWLFDFFMQKTASNILNSPSVALVAWENMKGVQIHAKASYLTSGLEFAEATEWVHEQNPSRILKGLIILTPTAIFDISPGGVFNPSDLQL